MKTFGVKKNTIKTIKTVCRTILYSVLFSLENILFAFSLERGGGNGSHDDDYDHMKA